MRRYKVPFSTDDEERIIGGRVSLQQMVYLLAGGILGLAIGYPLPLPLALKVVVGSIPFLCGASLALVGFVDTDRRLRVALYFSEKDIRLDTYIYQRFKFHTRNKEFPFQKRCG